MFGLRVLIFLAGVALVVWILVRLARGPKPLQRRSDKVERMVQCAHCGTYVPGEDAIRDGERFYCSEQHREEDRESR